MGIAYKNTGFNLDHATGAMPSPKFSAGLATLFYSPNGAPERARPVRVGTNHGRVDTEPCKGGIDRQIKTGNIKCRNNLLRPYGASIPMVSSTTGVGAPAIILSAFQAFVLRRNISASSNPALKGRQNEPGLPG